VELQVGVIVSRLSDHVVGTIESGNAVAAVGQVGGQGAGGASDLENAVSGTKGLFVDPVPVTARIPIELTDGDDCEVVTFWKVGAVLTSIVQVEVCDDECPIKKTADVIEGRWTTLVIRELLPGKKRFSEIQRALTGISPKVLTARLRLLEQRQLLTRTVYATVPPMTEYELTPLGRQLETVLDAMADFGRNLSSDASH